MASVAVVCVMYVGVITRQARWLKPIVPKTSGPSIPVPHSLCDVTTILRIRAGVSSPPLNLQWSLGQKNAAAAGELVLNGSQTQALENLAAPNLATSELYFCPQMT